jgi:hypothetical protein
LLEILDNTASLAALDLIATPERCARENALI